ncbi:MAG: hypothetical protein HKN49_06595 [Gammaproteobacteria bacterium]|nr:hypothetical protein [Gammaproteobacteria bacterium]
MTCSSGFNQDRQLKVIAAVALLFAASNSHAQELNWFGFAQLTATSTEADDSFEFGADGVRAGFTVNNGDWTSKLVLDLNGNNLDQSRPGSLPNIIFDLFTQYQLNDNHSVRLGQFKAPIGMDFSMPATGLDFTRRGLDAGLVLNRTLGVMLSGRRFDNGFGYDVGIFNPAGRSAATQHIGSGPLDQAGDDFSFAGRVLFDPSEEWHFEAALGSSQAAGGPGTEDLRVIDFGARWHKDAWTIKGEYITATDIRGSAGHDESVIYLHGEYAFSPRLSALVRHYHGESEVGSVSSDLDNTYFGLTWFLDQQRRSNNRIMVNYVLASGDTVRYTGVRGLRQDGLYIQYQFHYAD